MATRTKKPSAAQRRAAMAPIIERVENAPLNEERPRLGTLLGFVASLGELGLLLIDESGEPTHNGKGSAMTAQDWFSAYCTYVARAFPGAKDGAYRDVTEFASALCSLPGFRQVDGGDVGRGGVGPTIHSIFEVPANYPAELIRKLASKALRSAPAQAPPAKRAARPG